MRWRIGGPGSPGHTCVCRWGCLTVSQRVVYATEMGCRPVRRPEVPARGVAGVAPSECCGGCSPLLCKLLGPQASSASTWCSMSPQHRPSVCLSLCPNPPLIRCGHTGFSSSVTSSIPGHLPRGSRSLGVRTPSSVDTQFNSNRSQLSWFRAAAEARFTANEMKAME